MINERFGLTLTCQQIKGQKRRFKLNSGLDGRFKKGCKPNHCFKKGERNGIETEYKKGDIPKNWVPVGTERARSDGYVYVKVSDIRGVKYPHLINWKQKHIIVWEEAYGPVPEGSCIIFLDGNKTNVDLNNLACITESQRLIMNKKGLIYDDPELTKTGIAVARLIDTVNKKKNVKKS